MQTHIEDNVFKAIQDYGVFVDKEELIKALQYDRGQYEKGFADGMLFRKGEWISVEERLPDQDGKYLSYTRKGFTVLSYYYALEGEFGFEHWDVTHWMPLPEPPMKGGEE